VLPPILQALQRGTVPQQAAAAGLFAELLLGLSADDGAALLATAAHLASADRFRAAVCGTCTELLYNEAPQAQWAAMRLVGALIAFPAFLARARDDAALLSAVWAAGLPAYLLPADALPLPAAAPSDGAAEGGSGGGAASGSGAPLFPEDALGDQQRREGMLAAAACVHQVVQTYTTTPLQIDACLHVAAAGILLRDHARLFEQHAPRVLAALGEPLPPPVPQNWLERLFRPWRPSRVREAADTVAKACRERAGRPATYALRALGGELWGEKKAVRGEVFEMRKRDAKGGGGGAVPTAAGVVSSGSADAAQLRMRRTRLEVPKVGEGGIYKMRVDEAAMAKGGSGKFAGSSDAGGEPSPRTPGGGDPAEAVVDLLREAAEMMKGGKDEVTVEALEALLARGSAGGALGGALGSMVPVRCYTLLCASTA
jgi:hypothetical protein